MTRWICLCLLMMLGMPIWAVVLRQGGDITIAPGEVVNDDLVVSGGTVRMQGTVTGDLVVAAGTLEMTGRVGGNVMAACGTMTLNGPVGGSLYAAGGTVNTGAAVGRNLVVAAGTASLAGTTTVGRDLAISGGQTTVGATVKRNVQANAGNLTLTDQARIGGNLLANASNASIASGAVIAGTRTVTQASPRKERRTNAVGWVIWQLLSGLSLLVAGLLFIAAAPLLTAQTETMLRRHPWGSLLTGFLLLLLVPLAFIVILITIIGIPLAFILLGLYLIATFLSPIFLAILVGQTLWRRPGGSLPLALLIGIVLLILVRMIPILGALVTLAAVLFGLGALALAIQARTLHPFFREPTATPAV